MSVKIIKNDDRSINNNDYYYYFMRMTKGSLKEAQWWLNFPVSACSTFETVSLVINVSVTHQWNSVVKQCKNIGSQSTVLSRAEGMWYFILTILCKTFLFKSWAVMKNILHEEKLHGTPLNKHFTSIYNEI